MSNWYNAITFYGYKVYIPEEYTHKKFINILDGLNSVLEEPFQFKNIIGGFYMDDYFKEIFDTNCTIVIGFDVNNIKTLEIADTFAEYVIDNPILSGIKISKTARFYSGIDGFIIDEFDSDACDSDTCDSDTCDSDTCESNGTNGSDESYSESDSNSNDSNDSDVPSEKN